VRDPDESKAKKPQTRFRSRRASNARRRASSGLRLNDSCKKSADFDLGLSDRALERSWTSWLNNFDLVSCPRNKQAFRGDENGPPDERPAYFGDRILASSDHECKGLITARLVKKRVLHFD
jgi:hypothetical protein